MFLGPRLRAAARRSIVTKPIEPDLLGAQIGARGTRGLGFQGPMHPLMPSVLLRRRGGDQLRQDPEPNPPDGQGRQAPERGRRERHAVVGADDPGKPYSWKRRRKIGRAVTIAVESRPCSSAGTD